MRFMHTDYLGTVTGPYTAEEAVRKQGHVEASLHIGQVAMLTAELHSLQEMVGRLIDALPLTGRAGVQTLCEVLGNNNWKAE